MTAAQSLFTEAIEEHLALKRKNTSLDASMPLARYDIGDPLDRYPGGPVRAYDDVAPAAPATQPVSSAAFDPQATMVGAAPVAPAASEPLVGPTPEQAMEAAMTLDGSYAGRPLEPLGGMTPMLSLVEDIDDEVDAVSSTSTPITTTNVLDADVVQFPAAPETSAAPIEEQPIIVVDANEPLAPMGGPVGEPPSAASSRDGRIRKPRFFGIGRKKHREDAGDGWLSQGPRDFNWD